MYITDSVYSIVTDESLPHGTGNSAQCSAAATPRPQGLLCLWDSLGNSAGVGARPSSLSALC